MNNINPHVRATLEAKMRKAQTAPAFVAPHPRAAATQQQPEPVLVIEPELELVSPDPADDDAPELQGNAVNPDPEHDNPPEPPADGAYGYQTHVVITPERAEYLIGLNAKNNRNKKESKIARMARDQRKGFWRDETGETVKISKSGFMIDGQNRMHAVVRSRTNIVVDIAWNVPDDRILVIDGNAPRSTADDFKIGEVADRFAAGPLVRWVMGWEKGNYLNYGGRLAPTRAEILDRYQKEPQAFDLAATYGRAAHQQVASVNMHAASMAFWLFSKLPDDGHAQAERFFAQFIDGLGLEQGSPVTILRNRMISARGRDYNKTEQLALMIKAWNAFRTGRSMGTSGRVVLGQNKLTNETFPMPK